MAQGPLEKAFAASLRSAQVEARDRAGVQLCRRYCQLLDAARGTAGEASTYDALGPKLLTALSALGLTVAGRTKRGKEGADGDRPGSSKLDELRARRAARSR